MERAMSPKPISCRISNPRLPSKRRQRGLVVFIALLVMLGLALAGIALIRSTDTATRVNGNVAFKHAAVSAVDRGIEQTIHALWEAAPTLDRTQHNPAQNYYACVRGTNGGCLTSGSTIPKIPDLLTTSSGCAGAGLAAGLVANDTAGNKSCFVIERMCLNTGPAVGSNCNVSTATFGADPGTIHYTGLVRPGDAYYRVTVRVEGPRNTVSYAQSMLR
jgi:type IV pilus assembly protein PilX